MDERLIHGRSPVRIPVPGGKLIEELIGLASTKSATLSVAHMVAPPGWSEPPQKPKFSELTIQIRGAMQLDFDDGAESLRLEAGEVVVVPAGRKVRYSNPGSEEGEYWAVCWPAFRVEDAGRD